MTERTGLLAGKFQSRFGVESNGKPLDVFSQELEFVPNGGQTLTLHR